MDNFNGLCRGWDFKLPKIKYFVGEELKLVFGVTEGKWIRRGEIREEGCEKFSLRIVCQNSIP